MNGLMQLVDGDFNFYFESIEVWRRLPITSNIGDGAKQDRQAKENGFASEWLVVCVDDESIVGSSYRRCVGQKVRGS
jgi:hypothetical protein